MKRLILMRLIKLTMYFIVTFIITYATCFAYDRLEHLDEFPQYESEVRRYKQTKSSTGETVWHKKC